MDEHGTATQGNRTPAGRPPLSNLLVAGFFLAVFLSCFASVLGAEYAYRGDLRIIEGPTEPSAAETFADGRPIKALITMLLLRTATEIKHLRSIRLLGVLGIALLAWCVFQALARAGWSRFQSACVAVIMCTTLPFQVTAAWTQAAPQPLGALAAGLAFLLSERAFETPRRRSKWLLAAGASLALLAALAVYQPMAMFFWVFAAVALLKPDTTPRDMLRRFGGYCAIGFAGMLAGFAMYELSQTLASGHPPRTGLVRDVPTKVVWFLSIFLPQALNFALPSPSWLLLPEAGGDLSVHLYRRISNVLHLLDLSLLPSHEQVGPSTSHDLAFSPAAGGLSFVHKVLDTIIAWVVFVCIGGGLWRYFRGARGQRPWRCAIAVSLLLLSAAPNLMVESHFGDYRTMPAPASLVVLFAYFAFQGYCGRPGRAASPVPPVRAHAVWGVAAVACALSAAWHVRSYLVVPQVQELALVRSQIERADLSRIRSIRVVLLPRWQRGRLRETQSRYAPFRWREFGSRSLNHGSNAQAMVFHLLRKLAPEHAGLPIGLVAFEAAAALPPHPPDVLVVDLRRAGGSYPSRRRGSSGKRRRRPASARPGRRDGGGRPGVRGRAQGALR